MIKRILGHLDDVAVDDLKLYFVTRVLKPSHKVSDKVLDKYDFLVYQVDINDDVRQVLHDYSREQIQALENKNLELNEYDVIVDDSPQLLTYQLKNKSMSFYDVINKKLKAGVNIPKASDLNQLLETQELWAYCVALPNQSGDTVYTFRKMLRGKVAIDEKESDQHGKIQKFIRTRFNTNSSKLELLKGETINLDKKIDCIYFHGTFYVISKTQFEQIIGLEQEFKAEAQKVAVELNRLKLISGVDVITDEIEKSPSIHKKLVRISRLGEYTRLDAKKVKAIIRYAKQKKLDLKHDDGKLRIETRDDADLVIKFLVDYFKDSKITGITYGTYAGKILSQ